MTTATPNGTFAQLGTGAAGDRLSFAVVLQIFWRTLPLIRTVRRHLIFVASVIIVSFLIGVPLVLIFLDALWNGVLQGDTVRGSTALFFFLDPAIYAGEGAIEAAARATLRNRWLVGVVILVVVVAPPTGGMAYYWLWIRQRINQALRVHQLERFQQLSLRFHADARVGDSIYRIYQDSAMVTNVIDTLFLRPALFAIRFVIGLGVVFFFDWRLGLILMMILPPAFAIGYWASSRMRTRFRRAREATSDVTSRIQETLSGIKVIKAYGAESLEQGRFERDSLRAFDITFVARNLLAVYGVGIFWVAGTALLAVATWAAVSTVNEREVFGAWVFASIGLGFMTLGFDRMNLGVFNSFKTFSGYTSTAVEGAFSLWGRAQDIAIGLDRVFELLDMKPEVEDAPDAVPLPAFRDRIVYRNVSFAYQPDRPVLEGVDLEASAGTITAIVGPTGAGKSTLMSLLLRLFDPSEGHIEIDGRDLREVKIESLRNHIAIALQENILFGTTVRENIRYAVPDASDARVREAARVACAEEFIDGLPEGYDTLLGERGTKLSTGQRQRLSISRAIVKDTPILILDEPTAALDAETELHVLANLAEWGRGRAIFIITHRLSTIRRADRIVYLRDGRVIEHGSHAELMRRPGGAYRSFVELEDETRAAG